MSSLHVTVLIEDLAGWAAAAPPDMRFAALERAWTRGSACGLASATSNHLRFSLFGLEPEHAIPVAALTHVDDRRAHPGNDYYWLRVDPVTMWADLARVFMTRYGFADLDPYERNEVEACVREVLEAEGFDLHGEHPERWCIALGDPPGFEFTPLEQALGMDVAEIMPDHPEARQWRRILNEIQVALHNAPVNQRRRAAGKAEVNSVWFWGGGFIPDAVPSYLIDTVYSDHPVSRGLAIINDFRLKPLVEASDTDFLKDGQAVLIDWAAPHPGNETEAVRELAAVETLVGRLLDQARRGRLVLTLYDGSGRGRSFGARARRRFWRRDRRLPELLPAATGE